MYNCNSRYDFRLTTIHDSIASKNLLLQRMQKSNKSENPRVKNDKLKKTPRQSLRIPTKGRNPLKEAVPQPASYESLATLEVVPEIEEDTSPNSKFPVIPPEAHQSPPTGATLIEPAAPGPSSTIHDAEAPTATFVPSSAFEIYDPNRHNFIQYRNHVRIEQRGEQLSQNPEHYDISNRPQVSQKRLHKYDIFQNNPAASVNKMSRAGVEVSFAVTSAATRSDDQIWPRMYSPASPSHGISNGNNVQNTHSKKAFKAAPSHQSPETELLNTDEEEVDFTNFFFQSSFVSCDSVSMNYSVQD